MTERTSILFEDLMKESWKPTRFIKYCLDIEEQQDFEDR
jgi:hypothetical protein